MKNKNKFLKILFTFAISLISICMYSNDVTIIKTMQDKTKASYYHDKYDGRVSANGEIFKQDLMTCAYNVGKLPFGTNIKVTNLDNGNEIIVVLTDRLNPKPPFNNRIDLSTKAMSILEPNYKMVGLVNVRVEIVKLNRRKTKYIKTKQNEIIVKQIKL